MVQKKSATVKAMELLVARDYTERQLQEKLEQKEYPQEEIAEAISYVKSFRYIDDRRFASNYLEYHKDSRSYLRMEQDLMRKGIPAELIKQCWEEKLEEGIGYDEEKLIEEALRKKHVDLKQADYREKQRIAAFLYRKGFGMDAIRKYMVLDIT